MQNYTICFLWNFPMKQLLYCSMQIYLCQIWFDIAGPSLWDSLKAGHARYNPRPFLSTAAFPFSLLLERRRSQTKSIFLRVQRSSHKEEVDHLRQISLCKVQLSSYGSYCRSDFHAFGFARKLASWISLVMYCRNKCSLFIQLLGYKHLHFAVIPETESLSLPVWIKHCRLHEASQ